MAYFIKMGVLVAAIAALVALVAPLVSMCVDGFADFAAQFSPAIASVIPYLSFGRNLFNFLMGSSTAVTIILWFILLSPFMEHMAMLTNKVYRRITSL